MGCPGPEDAIEASRGEEVARGGVPAQAESVGRELPQQEEAPTTGAGRRFFNFLEKIDYSIYILFTVCLLVQEDSSLFLYSSGPFCADLMEHSEHQLNQLVAQICAPAAIGEV